MRISRRARHESHSEVAASRLSILMRLREGPRSPRDLAAAEGISAPSVTRTTSALLERGLIDRTPDPTDGRQVSLALTAEGERVIRDTLRRRDAWLHTRLADLSEDDVAVLRRATELLTEAAAR